MKHILIIEDNREISENTKQFLELEGFTVSQAFEGETGIDLATKGDYDLIVLDLMLPEVDGISIARRVREKKGTPIIMTTARETVADRLKGFEVGAVDYMIKPFNLSELHARIKVHLSHIPKNMQEQSQSSKIFNFGDVEIDLAKHLFKKKGEEVHLTQKEYLIIEKLIDNRESVVSRADIIEYLWGSENIFDGDNKLDVYISNIRSKLGKEIIKTIKGVGYTIGL